VRVANTLDGCRFEMRLPACLPGRG
jgi:hypothetical protein